MAKVDRKIFQPNALTAMLIDGSCDKDRGGANISEFTNNAIISYYTPYNTSLRKETEFIFQRIINGEQIAPEELKATLARCVDILKNYPVSDVRALEQVFIHFTYKRGRNLRYDYIQIVDEQQDRILHRLNDILATIDEDYTYGSREFGEKSRYVFAHWDELCRYSEIYTALATIIDCEDIYYPLSTFRTIDLIKWLDIAIRDSSLEAIKTPFETNLSITKRYFGILYEVSVYQTDNGYCALSGDIGFERMPNEIRHYYNKFANKETVHNEATDDDLREIAALEKESRMLFRRLVNPEKD